MRFTFIIIILLVSIFSPAKIRLRKVKDAPKTCSIMKEETSLSRMNKKIFGTEKNSVVIEDNVSLVGDLGHKLCEWPPEKFSPIGDLKNISFYINEYKNFIIAFQKNKDSVRQVQINIDSCQFDELKTLTQVSFPKCDPPRAPKNKKKIRRKTASDNRPEMLELISRVKYNS